MHVRPVQQVSDLFEGLDCRLTPYSYPASWLLTFLGAHPEWKAKAHAEIEAFMFSHSLTPYKAGAPLSDLSATLARIPLDAWEGSTPVLDAAIHETTRLAQPHTAMRKNMGPDVHIDGKLVPSGHYVVYPFSDVHLNEELYPDPWKFDPSRPRPDARFSHVGWGGGTIPLALLLPTLQLTAVHIFFRYHRLPRSATGEARDETGFCDVPSWDGLFRC